MKTFIKFCKKFGLDYKNVKDSIFHDTPSAQQRMAERYLFYLQRHNSFQGSFDQARAYLKTALLFYDIEYNPLDTMGRNRFRNLKLGFNKGSNPGTREKIALNESLVSSLIQKWCGSTSSNIYDQATSKMGLLGTATLVYLTTALRAGNILRGSSDNKDDLALHVGDVITFEQDQVFIINGRTKTSKAPIISHVPYNPHTLEKHKYCAATRLRNLAAWRRDKEGANDDDFLFINPRSKLPLSTSVANTSLQRFIKTICMEQNIAERLDKFFSLISLRKTVSTEMEKRNCTPQVIAFKLRHSTLNSQLSYICKHRTTSDTFTRDLYKSVIPQS